MDITPNQIQPLLQFIKDKLTDNEQLLFAESFHLYLQYNSEKDFVIDLDNVWKWLGFSRKDPAKRLLKTKFILDIDYIITIPLIGGKLNLGRPEEQILMNIKTFKKFCMKADTKRSDTILDYYIKLETCNQDFILHSLQETQKLLKEKDDKIKSLEKPNYYDVPKSQWVYIFQEISKRGQNIYKIGLASKSVDKRKKNYKTYSSDGFEEIFRFNTNNCYLLEHIIKQLLYKYKYGHESEKGGTEYYQCNIEYIKYVIKISATFIDTLFGTNEQISKPELIKHINNNLVKNLFGSDEYIKTFLPETILNSCQSTFNENHKVIKNKLKKHFAKNKIHEVTDNMCNDFNDAIDSILSPAVDVINELF
jgi:hypothetical protein